MSQVSAMQALAQDVVKNQRPLNDDEKATVELLNEQVVNPVLKDTQSEHDDAEQSLQNVKVTMDGCDTTLGQAVSVVNGKYSAIEKRRSDLQTCRGQEAQLLQANQTAGDALSGFLADAASDTPACNSDATVDALRARLSENKEWYSGKDTEYQQLRAAAQAAKAAHLAKLAECNKQESDLREAECDWKTTVQMGKDAYASCRADTQKSYDAALQAATSSSVGRKHIWSAITHLKCYLDVLTADQADMKDLLAKCKADKPNVDHLTIVEPSLPPVNEAQLAAMGDTSTVCN
jgi:DNA repair exonuclease SbcCD ATPase subunit